MSEEEDITEEQIESRWLKFRYEQLERVEPLARELTIRLALEQPDLKPKAISDAAWKLAIAHFKRLSEWLKTGE